MRWAGRYAVSERIEIVAATRAATAEAALRPQIGRTQLLCQGRTALPPIRMQGYRREAVAPVRLRTSSPISDGTGPSGNGQVSCEAREGVILAGLSLAQTLSMTNAMER